MAKGKTIEQEEAESKEVVLSHSSRQNAVGQVSSLDELRNILGSTRTWDEIEPSFTVVKKDLFTDKPFVIGSFRFNQSSKYMMKNPDNKDVLIPAEFVSMLVAQYDPKSEELIPLAEATNHVTGEVPNWVIINDGSTGIRDQLTRYAEKYDDDPRKCPPLMVTKGLRKSEYDFDIDGEVGRGVTFYLG